MSRTRHRSSGIATLRSNRDSLFAPVHYPHRPFIRYFRATVRVTKGHSTRIARTRSRCEGRKAGKYIFKVHKVRKYLESGNAHHGSFRTVIGNTHTRRAAFLRGFVPARQRPRAESTAPRYGDHGGARPESMVSVDARPSLKQRRCREHGHEAGEKAPTAAHLRSAAVHAHASRDIYIHTGTTVRGHDSNKRSSQKWRVVHVVVVVPPHMSERSSGCGVSRTLSSPYVVPELKIGANRRIH